MTEREQIVKFFCSVDLVGATAYKAHSKTSEWIDTFLRFYESYPEELQKPVFSGRTSTPMPPEIRPVVVKAIGDELLLQTTLTCGRHADLLIRELGASLARYEEAKLVGTNLRLKATAWIASFPEPNRQVNLPSQDFVGPSIDTGFRLARFATPDKIPVSVELALLLAQAQMTRTGRSESASADFYFDGTHSLRGVLGGRPYPIFSYPTDNDDRMLLLAEQELTGSRPTYKSIVKYCQSFIKTCRSTSLVEINMPYEPASQ